MLSIAFFIAAFFIQCWDNAAIALSQRNYQLLKRSKYILGIPVQHCMM